MQSAHPTSLTSRVGAVVIGRNEGPRLLDCLRSVTSQLTNVVYVDSGSSDGSAEQARALGVHVVELTTGPFRAARGRQAGMDELLRRTPHVELIQFIDGDCILDPAWLPAAVAHLDAHPHVAAVSGRRREERPGQSLYVRLIDMDWDVPAGPALYFGGDALGRVDAIRRAGGWPVELIAGEEPDLGFRMNDGGARIERIACEMTRHDVRMTRWGEYRKRAIRTGHAYAEVGWRRRRGVGAVWLRRAVSAGVYGAILPVVALLGAIWAWPLLVLVLLLYARLLVVVTWRCRRRGYPLGLSAAYAAFNLLGKFAEAYGVAKYAVGRLLRKTPQLIEYRQTDAGGSVAHAPQPHSEAPVVRSNG